MKRIYIPLVLLIITSCNNGEEHLTIDDKTVEHPIVEQEIPEEINCENSDYLVMEKLRILTGEVWGEKDSDGNFNNLEIEGAKYSQAYYRGQFFTGTAKECDGDRITRTMEFFNGYPHGKVINYNKDGTVSSTREHKNGYASGTHTTYDEEGKLKWEFFHDDYGNTLKSNYFKDGELFEESWYEDGEIVRAVVYD